MTVIFEADQIPFWVKIGSRKALYASWEKKQKGDRRTATSYDRTGQKLRALAQVEEAGQKKAEEGMTQMRGRTNVEEDKCRICLEARQVIYHWFDKGRDPVGDIMPSLLVVHGAHARISNIDDTHHWIKDEKFYVGPVLVEHKAGDYTASLYDHVELRKIHPEWYVELVVMSQPAACVDEILYVWSVQDVAQRFPNVLQLRDLLGVAMTDRSKAAMRLASQVGTWVGPGMTPVLQLTDTDLAFLAQAG